MRVTKLTMQHPKKRFIHTKNNIAFFFFNITMPRGKAQAKEVEFGNSF